MIEHIPGDKNDADIFTKNVSNIQSSHTSLHRELHPSQTRASSGEAVKGLFCSQTQNGGNATIDETGLS